MHHTGKFQVINGDSYPDNRQKQTWLGNSQRIGNVHSPLTDGTPKILNKQRNTR